MPAPAEVVVEVVAEDEAVDDAVVAVDPPTPVAESGPIGVEPSQATSVISNKIRSFLMLVSYEVDARRTAEDDSVSSAAVACTAAIAANFTIRFTAIGPGGGTSVPGNTIGSIASKVV